MQRHQQSPSSQLLQTECLIYPDSVTVNGDLLTADGRMKGKLVRLQIQLKSENEQQKWRMDAPSFTRLSCMGRFQSVNTSRNQHAFDYEKYLQDKNYFGLFVVKKYRVLSGSAWQTLLSQLRFYCIKQVREQLSRKASQYVQALVFGYKNQDFQEMQSLYSMSGILHLFTISGMHVIFFLGLFDYFFRRLHLSFAQRMLPFIVCALMSMFLFGISMSVLRATFTYLLTYLLNHLSIKLSRLDRFSIVLLILMVIFPNTLLVLSGQLSLLVSFLLIFIPNAKSKWQSLLFMQYLHVLTAPLLFCVFFQWPILGGILTAVFSYLFTFLLLPYCFGLFLLTFIPPLLPFFNLPFDWIVKGIEYSLQFLVNFQLHFGTIPSWLVGICLILGLLFRKRPITRYIENLQSHSTLEILFFI
ncbi:ComEC/Rec2 family competence protein, partial [Enterococcus cecorum]